MNALLFFFGEVCSDDPKMVFNPLEERALQALRASGFMPALRDGGIKAGARWSIGVNAGTGSFLRTCLGSCNREYGTGSGTTG